MLCIEVRPRRATRRPCKTRFWKVLDGLQCLHSKKLKLSLKIRINNLSQLLKLKVKINLKIAWNQQHLIIVVQITVIRR